MTHFEWEGKENAPVLVLSHSLGANLNFWAPQVEAFGRSYRILLYDLRGHGNSSAPDGEWSIEDFGKDALSLLDKVGGESFTFCGLSLGGMIGMWLASQVGERMDRLILANTTSQIKDTTLLYKRIKQISKEGMESVSEIILQGWFSKYYSGDLSGIRSSLLKCSEETYIKSAKAVCTLNLEKEIEEISCPTLVITGKYDQATPSNWGKEMADSITNSTHVELPTAHMSNLEAPESFNEVVLDWMGLYLKSCRVKAKPRTNRN